MGLLLPETASNAEVMELLGGRLRSLRKSRALTIGEVAGKTGLSRRTVARAESGRNPTLGTIVELLRAYGRLDALAALLPEPELSPMDMLKRTRKRKNG